MANRKPETVYLDTIREELRRYGAKEIKLHGNAFSKAGNPDVIGVLKGLPFVIEAKIEGEVPRPKQDYELDGWEAVGAFVVRATDGTDKPKDVAHRIAVEAYMRANRCK